MLIVNVANPLTLLLILFLTLSFIYIGKQAKNAYVALLPLIVFLILLVMHSLQILIFSVGYNYATSFFANCLLVDFIMIFLTYMAYLWVDDIEAKAKMKKSIDNSLDWFWKNV